MVNAELMRLGYAQVMTIPPNVWHAELFPEASARGPRSRTGALGAVTDAAANRRLMGKRAAAREDALMAAAASRG